MFDTFNLNMISFEFLINFFSSSNNVYFITKYIFLIFLIIDSLELISIIKKNKFDFIWSDKIIKHKLQNYHTIIQIILKPFLINNIFKFIPFFIILLVTLLLKFDNPMLYFLLLFIRFIISIKFGGSFNGGSDSMIIVIIIGLFISSLETQFLNLKSTNAGLFYIGLQSIISYFRAGIVKLKNPEWRNGIILPKFYNHSIYLKNKYDKLFFDYLSTNKYQISTLLCNFVIFWEVLFPISLFNINILLIFLIIGIIFHTLNFYILGLNRFLIAWVATYPSLLFLSLNLNL